MSIDTWKFTAFSFRFGQEQKNRKGTIQNMTKFGQVIAYNQDGGIATIRYARPEACEHCGACGQGGREETIDLPAQCAVGNWVRVELPDGKFLTASLFAYVVPLILFLGGFFLGNALTGSEGLTVLFGLIGLALGCAAVFFINKAIARREEWRPRITAVYEDCPEQAQMGCNGGK
jgi:positive regulator of sigma E activity